MKKIRCIIVDDEKLAREGIRHLLESQSDFDILDLCRNGTQAVESITHYQPDVVFLDIKMPDLNGFEVIEALDSFTPPIIVFITAYNAFAIEAFEVCAFDYLLKPFDDDRFYKLLDRTRHQHKMIVQQDENSISELLDRVDQVVQNNISKSKNYLTRIMVKRSGGVSFLDVSDILCIEAADYYVRIVTGKQEYLLRKSLNSFEEKLNPSEFIRIHRATIINVSAIINMIQHSDEEHIAVLRNGKEYRISRSGKKKLDQHFQI